MSLSETCRDQVMSLVAKLPRYLVESALCCWLVPNIRSTVRSGIFSAAHFSVAKSILSVFTHCWMLFRCSWICHSVSPVNRSFRSSAKMNGSLNINKSGWSLIRMQNNRGPSREPYGTALVISKFGEEQIFIRTKHSFQTGNCGAFRGSNHRLQLKRTFIVVDSAVRGQRPLRSRSKKQLHCHKILGSNNWCILYEILSCCLISTFCARNRAYDHTWNAQMSLERLIHAFLKALAVDVKEGNSAIFVHQIPVSLFLI